MLCPAEKCNRSMTKIDEGKRWIEWACLRKECGTKMVIMKDDSTCFTGVFKDDISYIFEGKK